MMELIYVSLGSTMVLLVLVLMDWISRDKGDDYEG